jgi:hypothetical protein
MHSNPDDEIGGYYVSTHAANIFLSEVRNTCFDADALDTLNTFLDDLLYAILQASGDAPLVTDHIRQGLLKTLSNPLGQAALLEAEIELRAYRDASRTTKPKKVEGEELPATWAFKACREIARMIALLIYIIFEARTPEVPSSVDYERHF